MLDVAISLCPRCGAPLEGTAFARQIRCKFCNALVAADASVVLTERYREALAAWNDPKKQGYFAAFRIGDQAWATLGKLADGDRYRLYLVERARSPRARGVLRVAKRAADAETIARTFGALEAIGSTEAGAAAIAMLGTQPVVRGKIDGGPERGAEAVIYRFRPTFQHDLVSVRRAYPAGVDARVAMWTFRRIAESLALIHRAGFAHGAILPAHVVLENGEHGAMLVGASYLRRLDDPREALPASDRVFEHDLPAKASAEGDIILTARTIGWLLGGDERGRLPSQVPAAFAETIARLASGRFEKGEADAWTLRRSLGEVARASFGPPSFCPLVMPG